MWTATREVVGIAECQRAHQRSTDETDPRRLAAAIAAIDAVLPGSIVIRRMRGGKAACRCKADPPTFHGPYVQWTRKVAGKP